MAHGEVERGVTECDTLRIIPVIEFLKYCVVPLQCMSVKEMEAGSHAQVPGQSSIRPKGSQTAALRRAITGTFTTGVSGFNKVCATEDHQ